MAQAIANIGITIVIAFRNSRNQIYLKKNNIVFSLLNTKFNPIYSVSKSCDILEKENKLILVKNPIYWMK